MKFLSAWVCVGILVTAGCGDKPPAAAPSADSGAGSGEGDGSAVAQSFDSPDAVFNAFAAATKGNDWQSAVGMITDESKEMIVLGMVMQASFMTMDDQAKGKALEELFKKHGLDEETLEGPGAEDVDINEAIKDLPAFVGELGKWIQANADESEDGFPEMTKMSDLKIDGDSATASVETEMGAQPIEFRKVDGQWKLHLAMGPPPEPSIDELGIDFDNKGDGEIGMMKMGDQQSGLNHAFAYRGKFFDEPCINLVFTAEEISEEQRNELQKQLSENDGDAIFFADGPNVKLTLSPEGELISMFAWIDNTSTSSNRGPAVDIDVDGDTIKGRVAMVSDGDEENAVQFQAQFETKIGF